MSINYSLSLITVLLILDEAKANYKSLPNQGLLKNIRESKFRKPRSSFNLRFKLTKDENCEMVIF